jgi:protein NEDD1
METSSVMNLVLEKLEGLTKEVQQLRRENQQLRHQLL